MKESSVDAEVMILSSTRLAGPALEPTSATAFGMTIASSYAHVAGDANHVATIDLVGGT